MLSDKNTFTHSLRVRYAEVDSQGIVFNANYLNYLDVAITEYFRAQGIAYSDFLKYVSYEWKYRATDWSGNPFLIQSNFFFQSIGKIAAESGVVLRLHYNQKTNARRTTYPNRPNS